MKCKTFIFHLHGHNSGSVFLFSICVYKFQYFLYSDVDKFYKSYVGLYGKIRKHCYVPARIVCGFFKLIYAFLTLTKRCNLVTKRCL